MTDPASASTATIKNNNNSNSNNNNNKDALIRTKGMEFARKHVENSFAQSLLEDRTNEYPKFNLSEVKLGKVLGRGGFGTVSEVLAFNVDEDVTKQSHTKNVDRSSPPHPLRQSKIGKSVRNFLQNHQDDDVASDETVGVGQMESRKFIAEHCIRNGGDARYALKILSPDVVADTGKYIQGVIDMALETRFLSDIEHPNIVKLRAMAQCEPYDSNNEKYFIVMDRLYDTLEKRLQTWGVKSRRHAGIGRLAGGKKKAAALYEERLVAAFDLSAAVAYLHERGIIYRDLKPENVGFDIRGDIKIFDFGLAKELNQLKANDDGTYKLTGMTGSPRYMAPEVGLELPYNATCDSYSFAILLWEMLALKTPFELYTMKSIRSRVWDGEQKRPPVDESWSQSLKLCLKRSWTADVKSRNTMAQITTILRKECVRVRDGDEAGLEHNRRRSTFVFRPKNKAGKRAAPVVARADILAH